LSSSLFEGRRDLDCSEGNLTRTTSPGWEVVGIEVRLGQPFLEPELPQAHPFTDVNTLSEFLKDDLELLRMLVNDGVRVAVGARPEEARKCGCSPAPAR